MLIIVGVDPGGTTGLAVYEPGDSHFKEQTELGPHEHHTDLFQYLSDHFPDTIVCERFDYRPKQKAAELTSVEYIGIIKYFCDYATADLVLQQQLKGDKGLWTDDKLKALGLYKVGMPHANDATRQVLYYVTVTMGDKMWLHNYKKAIE